MESSWPYAPFKPNQGSQEQSAAQPRWFTGDVKHGSPSKFKVIKDLTYENLMNFVTLEASATSKEGTETIFTVNLSLCFLDISIRKI